MSEELVIRQAAPTLAGIKTGSLFSCTYDVREKLLADIRGINRKLVPKGLCMVPLRLAEGKALLYLYRPRKLAQDLQEKLAEEMLSAAGYQCGNIRRCVVQLCRRLQHNGEFPHEIGFFLSYPPEDVKGFIDNRAAGCKLMGLWKVYGDEEQAKALFASYKACTRLYCRLWQAGADIGQLAVVV